jgi:hypothetical protein
LYSKRKDFCYVLLALSVACYFAYVTFGYTTEDPITKDALENARAAYHLVDTGVMGADAVETANPKPQIRREPVPILVIAAFLLVHPEFDRPYTIAELTSGPLAQSVKGVNAFWRFLAALFIFLLCKELFADWLLSAAIALVCLAVSEVLFFARPPYVDRLYTEIPAAALILVGSWSAVRFVRTKSIGRAAWLGVALGALALTKAAFLYTAIGFVALLATLEGLKLLQAESPSAALRKVSSAYAVLIIAMFATNATWIVRNYAEFGKPQTSRGEDVLGYRLLMSEQPLLGLIYAHSPGAIRRVSGPWIGYSAEDLKPGGRLDENLPAQGKIADIVKRMKAEGFEGNEGNHERLRGEALDFVIQNPLRYVATIGVFAYKGMWFMKYSGGWVAIAFNAVAILCFLSVFLGAVVAGNLTLVATFGLSAGLFLFTSMFTQAFTRFNGPITPIVILSVLVLLVPLCQSVFRSLSRGWLPFSDSRVSSSQSCL